MAPAAGTCSRARPLPTGSTRRPSPAAVSTTLRSAEPVNDGTATRAPASTTTEPFVRGCTCGATMGARSAVEAPEAASGIAEFVPPLALKAASTLAGRRPRMREVFVLPAACGDGTGAPAASVGAAARAAFASVAAMDEARSGSSAGRLLISSNIAFKSPRCSLGASSAVPSEAAAINCLVVFSGWSWGTPRYSRTCCARTWKTGADTAVP